MFVKTQSFIKNIVMIAKESKIYKIYLTNDSFKNIIFERLKEIRSGKCILKKFESGIKSNPLLMFLDSLMFLITL